MNYQIQRAIRTENDVINLGELVHVVMKDQTTITCTLMNIYWLDEYTAIMYTDRGEISLEDVKFIMKLGVA
jgi:hypothetical protein